MGRIRFFFEKTEKIKLPRRKLIEFIKQTSGGELYSCGDINFILCNDDYLLEINKEFLKHDFYTDIITFDYSVNKTISGDLYISLERIRENAELYDSSFIEELVRVMIHGILHLVGYKDKTKSETKIMREKENYYVTNFFRKI